MLIFAFLTIGYFAGVITALLIFPPRIKEIEMQETDVAKPVNDLIESENPQLVPSSQKNLTAQLVT